MNENVLVLVALILAVAGFSALRGKSGGLW